MIKSKGKVYEIVKEYLEQKGVDTSTLKIMTLGRTTYHDIILEDRVIGTYERNSRELSLSIFKG